jgi:dTDP-4-amino-4,6-dideoxygalactose transaminase
LFVLLCDQRDALMAHLERSGVQALVHYPVPVHRQEPCLQSRRDPAGLANAERHAATCMSIPCHPQLTDRDVQAVVAAVNRFRPA